MISSNSANAIDYFATIGRPSGPLIFQNTSADPDGLQSKSPADLWQEAITEVIVFGHQEEPPNPAQWTIIGEPYGVNKLVLAFRRRKFSKKMHHIVSIKFVSEFQLVIDDYQIVQSSISGQYKALLPQGLIAVKRSNGNNILDSGPFLQNISFIKIPRSPGNLLINSSSSSTSTIDPFSSFISPRYHLIPRVNYRNEKINPIDSIYAAKYASSLSLSNLSFKASTVDRYPLTDYPDLPLPSSPLPIFAFPRNLRLEIRSRHEYPPSSFYSFVFSTLNKNEPLYAVCLKFYEIVDPEDLLPLVSSIYGEKSVKLEQNQKIFCPKVICLLSRYPLYRMMSKYLKQIYALSLSANNCPLEHFISSVVGAVPIPLSGGRPFHIVLDAGLIPSNARGMSPIEITKPPDYCFPWVDLDFSAPFRNLSVELVLVIFSILLQENRVLFMSCSNQMLTETMEVFRHLLFPLKWSCNFVSRLPQSLSEYLEAPGGFMMGLHFEPSELNNYFDNIPSVDSKDNSQDIRNTVQKYLANIHQDYPISPGTFVVDLVNGSVLFKPDPEIKEGPLSISSMGNPRDISKIIKLTQNQCRSLLDILPSGPRVRLQWTLEKICSLYNFIPQQQPLFDDNVFDYFTNFEEEDEEYIQIINDENEKHQINQEKDKVRLSTCSSSSSSSSSSESSSSSCSSSDSNDCTLSLSESSDSSSSNDSDSDSDTIKQIFKSISDDEGFGEHDQRESFSDSNKEKSKELTMLAKIRPNYLKKAQNNTSTNISSLFNFFLSSNGQRTVYNPITNTTSTHTSGSINTVKGPISNEPTDPLINNHFCSSNNNLLNIYFPSLAIRDAFLSFMADILGDFSKFCIMPHPTISPSQVNNSSYNTPLKFNSGTFDKTISNSKSVHKGYNTKFEYDYISDDINFTKDDFDRLNYISSSDPSCRPLLQHLVDTQMFSFLMQQRSEVMFQNHANSHRPPKESLVNSLISSGINNPYSSHLLFFEEAAALQRQLMLSALVPLIKGKLQVPELPLPLYQLVDANKKWASIPQTVKHRILYCLSNGCYKLYYSNNPEDKDNISLAKNSIPICPDKKVGGCVYRGRFHNEFIPVSSDSDSDNNNEMNDKIIIENEDENIGTSSFSNYIPASIRINKNTDFKDHHRHLLLKNKKLKKEFKNQKNHKHNHRHRHSYHPIVPTFLELSHPDKPVRESKRKRIRKFLHLEHSRESFSQYYTPKSNHNPNSKNNNSTTNQKYFTILSSSNSTSSVPIAMSNNNINTVSNCCNIHNFFNINLNTQLNSFNLNMIQYQTKNSFFNSDVEDSFRYSPQKQYVSSLLLNQLLHFLHHLFGSHSDSYLRQIKPSKVKKQSRFIKLTISKFIYGEQMGDISRKYNEHLYTPGKIFKGCQSECSDGFCCPCSYLHGIICKPSNFPSAATEASILTQLILPEKFTFDVKPLSSHKPMIVTNHQPFSPLPTTSNTNQPIASPIVYRTEYHTINDLTLNEYCVSKNVKAFQNPASDEIDEIHYTSQKKKSRKSISKSIKDSTSFSPPLAKDKLDNLYSDQIDYESNDFDSIDMNELLLNEDKETEKISHDYHIYTSQDIDGDEDSIDSHLAFLLKAFKNDVKILKKWNFPRKEFSERLNLHLDHRECGPLILPGPTLPSTHRLSMGGGLIPNPNIFLYEYKDGWPQLDVNLLEKGVKNSIFWRLPLLQKVREIILHSKKTKSCYSVRTAFERNIHPLIHTSYPISPFRSDEISLKPYLTPHPPSTFLHTTNLGVTGSFQSIITPSNSNIINPSSLYNPHLSPYAQCTSYPVPSSSINVTSILGNSNSVNPNQLTLPTQNYPSNTSSYPLIQPPIHPTHITPISLLIDQVSISITLLCQRVTRRIKPLHDLLQICGIISQLEQIGIASHLRESVWLSILIACGSYNDCLVIIKNDNDFEENFSLCMDSETQDNVASSLDQFIENNLDDFEVDYETLYGSNVEVITEEEWEFVKFLASIIFHYILASGITPSSLTHAQYMDIINSTKKCVNTSNINKEKKIGTFLFNDDDDDDDDEIKPTILDMDDDLIENCELNLNEINNKNGKKLSEKEIITKLLSKKNSQVYIDTFHFLEEIGAVWFIKKKEIVCKEWANEYINQVNSNSQNSTPPIGIATTPSATANSFYLKQNSTSIKKTFFINLLSPISYSKELSDYYKILTPQKQSLSPFFLPRQMSAVSIPSILAFPPEDSYDVNFTKKNKHHIPIDQRVIDLYKQITKRKKLFLRHSSFISIDQMVFEIENEKSQIQNSSLISPPITRSFFNSDSTSSIRIGDMSPMSIFNKFRKSTSGIPPISSNNTLFNENSSTPISSKAHQIISPSVDSNSSGSVPVLSLVSIKSSSQKSFSIFSGPSSKEFASMRFQEKEKDEMRELSSNLFELLLSCWSSVYESENVTDSNSSAIAIHSQLPCSCGFTFMEEEIFSLWSNANYVFPETLGATDTCPPLNPIVLTNGRRVPQFIRNPELGLFCTSCSSVISLKLNVKCYSLAYEKNTSTVQKSKNSRSYLKTHWEQIIPFLSPSSLYLELEKILPSLPLNGVNNSIYNIHPTLYWNIKYHLTRTCLPSGLFFDSNEPLSIIKMKHDQLNFNDPKCFLQFPVIIGYREEVVRIKIKRFLQGIPDNFFDVEDLARIYSSEDVQILRDEVIPQLDGTPSALKHAIIAISKCKSILEVKSLPISPESSISLSTSSSPSTTSNSKTSPPKTHSKAVTEQIKFISSRQLFITLLILSTSLGHYSSYELPKNRPSSLNMSSTPSTPSIGNASISTSNQTYNLFYYQHPHLLYNLLDTGTFQTTLEDCLLNYFDDNEMKQLKLEKDILLNLCKSPSINTFHAMFHTVT